jgi:hypothetical protein
MDHTRRTHQLLSHGYHVLLLGMSTHAMPSNGRHSIVGCALVETCLLIRLLEMAQSVTIYYIMPQNWHRVVIAIWSRDRSVSIEMGYRLDGHGSWYWKDLSFLHSIQTDSGGHPASYPIGFGGSFPRGKATRAWSWPFTPSNVRIKNSGAYFCSPTCLHGTINEAQGSLYLLVIAICNDCYSVK